MTYSPSVGLKSPGVLITKTVRKAFHDLSKRVHPDKNPKEEVMAARAFVILKKSFTAANALHKLPDLEIIKSILDVQDVQTCYQVLSLSGRRVTEESDWNNLNIAFVQLAQSPNEKKFMFAMHYVNEAKIVVRKAFEEAVTRKRTIIDSRKRKETTCFGC